MVGFGLESQDLIAESIEVQCLGVSLQGTSLSCGSRLYSHLTSIHTLIGIETSGRVPSCFILI